MTRSSRAPRPMPTYPGRRSSASSISSPPAAMRLRTYERYARIRKTPEGRWRVSNPQVRTAVPPESRHHRRRGDAEHSAGEAQCAGFARSRRRRCSARSRSISSRQLSPGDTFLFSGRCCVSRASARTNAWPREAFSMDPKIPAYAGGKFPLSTYLADQVRAMIDDPERAARLPDQVRDWLEIQNGQVVAAEARRIADRDFSARQPRLHGRLSLRRTAGAPDAWHAA